MKKLYALLALALASTASAFAQWNTNATPACVYSTKDNNSDYHATTLMAARTPDKKTWLAWKTWEGQMVNGKRCLGVHTYLQLLDIDGKPQFDEPLLVNNHVTASWWSTYGLCVAADGSAIVTVADGRLEESGITDDGLTESYSAQGFCPAIYKVDQEGNFLWGLDGIEFTDYTDSPFTNAYVVSNDTYFIFDSTSNGENDHLNIIRIDDDGTLGWEAPRPLDGVRAQIVPSTDNEFLLFDDCPNGARVQRYDRDFNSVWGDPVIYDEHKYDGYELNPYKLTPDGQGGAAVAFVRTMGQFAHNVRVQHINADGSLGFGLTGIDCANTEDNDYDYCGIAVNPETEEILVDFESQLERTYDVMLQKFSFDGDYLLDELAISIASKDRSTNSYAFGRVGIGAVPGTSDWIVAYRDVQAYGANTSFIIRRYDKDGNRVWTRTIGRQLDTEGVKFIVEKEASYLFYREFSTSKEPGVKVFRISHNDDFTVDYSNGIADATTATATAATRYYSLDGKQLQQPQRGLNIVRNSDGTVTKQIR